MLEDDGGKEEVGRIEEEEVLTLLDPRFLGLVDDELLQVLLVFV